MSSLGWTTAASGLAVFIGLFLLAGASTSATPAPLVTLVGGVFFLGGLLWLLAAITARLVRSTLSQDRQ